jgi:hypothetical protein
MIDEDDLLERLREVVLGGHAPRRGCRAVRAKLTGSPDGTEECPAAPPVP